MSAEELKPTAIFATDYVEDPPEGRKIEDVVKAGYVLDIVVFFPRCFVPERCPAERYRGYFLCTDCEEKRCAMTYRQAEEVVCRLGEYALLSKKKIKEAGLKGKVLVIPGGRQVADVCLTDGLPRAVVGVACPPDLKEGREKMEKINVKPFLVPVTKIEYEVKNLKKTTIESCYENVVMHGTDAYLKVLDKAIEYCVKHKD
jgi:hypothetical protein